MRKPARFFFALATLALAACAARPAGAGEPTTPAPAPASPTAPREAATVSATPSPQAPTATRTPSPVVPTVPFVPDCTDTRGTVSNYNYHAYTLGYSLFYDVYLPPCYEASGDYYPVIYLMHGQAFIEDQWDRLGANEAADALIAAGEAPPFIMIMPRGGANSYFGQGLVKDLIPYVETTYRIQRDREHRAIGGLSRGAGWAIYLGLLHPDLFSAIGGHSPAVQFIHAPQIDNLLDDLPEDQIPRIWLDIGDTDSLMYNTEWFMEMLDERGIPFHFELNEGRHEEAYWSEHVRDYIQFYTEAW
jgi:enterochelin esterase-like enzyme